MFVHIGGQWQQQALLKSYYSSHCYLEEMVSTRLHEKPWNRIDFESIFVAGGQIELAELQRAAYTYRTAFVIYAQVHCTIAQLQQCHLDKQLQVYTECPCSDDKSVQRIHALSNEAVVVLLFIMAVLLGPKSSA